MGKYAAQGIHLSLTGEKVEFAGAHLKSLEETAALLNDCSKLKITARLRPRHKNNCRVKERKNVRRAKRRNDKFYRR